MKVPITKTIEEITETLIDYRGKTPHKTHDGVKLITAKVIKDGFVSSSNHEYIAEQDYDTWMRRGLPKRWDILITTEAPLGEVAQLRTRERIALAQRVILLRGNPSLIDQQYYFHALKSPFVQGELAKRATGTTVLGIKQSELRKVRIPYFSLPTQQKIANILSAYDDFIENNTRRIKILEALAQLIYDEWFVKFRFPGHEKVKLVESELGSHPDEWAVVPFTDIADVLSGGTPRTTIPEYWDGEIPFFTPRDAPGGFYVLRSEKNITKLGLENCNSKLYPEDSVFITARGTVGKVVLAGREMAMNQSCYALVGRDGIPQHYVFLATMSCVDYLKKNTGGATFDTIVVDTFRRLKTLKAPSSTVKEIDILVSPMFTQILSLARKNENLRSTRDILLPKLISGEIDVEKLDIKVDAAAAEAVAATL